MDYREYPDWRTNETIVISGPLEKEPDVDILTGQPLIGRGGKLFNSLEEAYAWVKERFTIVEVIYDAELYGSRWAFRVVAKER